MNGMTPAEAAKAIDRGGRAAAFGLALAELSMFWDAHNKNAPDMHEPHLCIRIEPGTDMQDGIDTVQAIADWLGVTMNERYGVYHAQQRFGKGADSIILECHFTPDQDRTHALIREAVKHASVPAAEAQRELAGAA